MTDRQLLRIARDTLTRDEFNVWFAKHYNGNGRRTGAQALGITEDAWKHRLARANAKITAAIDQENAA